MPGNQPYRPFQQPFILPHVNPRAPAGGVRERDYQRLEAVVPAWDCLPNDVCKLNWAEQALDGQFPDCKDYGGFDYAKLGDEVFRAVMQLNLPGRLAPSCLVRAGVALRHRGHVRAGAEGFLGYARLRQPGE